MNNWPDAVTDELYECIVVVDELNGMMKYLVMIGYLQMFDICSM